MLLPPADLFRLIAGERFGEIEPHLPCVQLKLPGIFSRMLQEGGAADIVEDSSYEPDNTIYDRSVLKELDRLLESHSLEPEPVRRRIMQITIIGGPDKGGMSKGAAVVSDAAGEYLAREYAKYQFAFLNKTADEYTIRLTLAHNLANV
jgi:hypothetical protein